uniref:Uncharacterized protein LOC111115067 isoform X2 n=1 Tax=Crassostrea virginica TaxID=6565 RepID=A0A8B8C2Y3_CRAVI|nr:uncharacterized protein LOC111115067 isoform X2 [Crassostrea virginica]
MPETSTRPAQRPQPLLARYPRDAREIHTRHPNRIVGNPTILHPWPQRRETSSASRVHPRHPDGMVENLSRRQLSARNPRDARESRRENSIHRVSKRHPDDPLREEDLRHIISKLNDDWYQFGCKLGFLPYILSQIRNNRTTDERNQDMLKMFQEWQKKSRNIYREGKEKLLNVFLDLQRPDLARFIQEKFTIFRQ